MLRLLNAALLLSFSILRRRTATLIITDWWKMSLKIALAAKRAKNGRDWTGGWGRGSSGSTLGSRRALRGERIHVPRGENEKNERTNARCERFVEASWKRGQPFEWRMCCENAIRDASCGCSGCAQRPVTRDDATWADWLWEWRMEENGEWRMTNASRWGGRAPRIAKRKNRRIRTYRYSYIYYNYVGTYKWSQTPAQLLQGLCA